MQLQKLALFVLISALLLACHNSRRVSPSDVDGDLDGDVDGDGDADGYVVHEWGVFTDGSVRATPGSFGMSTARKPVLYFYTTEPIDVAVEVDLPGGVARETWPEVDLAETIGWPVVQVAVDPCDGFDPFPEPGEGQCPWTPEFFCEATELGEYLVDEASCLTVGDQRSPLLFYSGDIESSPIGLEGEFCLDELDPGLTSAVTIDLTNQLDEPAGPVFLIYRNLQGECFPDQCVIERAEVATAWAELDPGQTLGLDLEVIELMAEATGETVMPPDWLMAEEASLTTVLTDRGLTDAEAEALLDGWRHTFLDLQPDDNMISVPLGPSVAVIAPVSDEQFDQALPLRLEPAPRELTRVGLTFQFLRLGACAADS